LLNRVSYAFSSRKLSFLNEKAIFPQRESIADSTKNMAFLREKRPFFIAQKTAGVYNRKYCNDLWLHTPDWRI